MTHIHAGDVVRYDLPATAALAAYPEWAARNGREFVAIEDETRFDGVELWDDQAESPFAAVGAYCTVIRRSAPVIPGFWIAPDPFDDTILWWRDPSHDEPQPIVMQAEVPPALWQAIAALAGHAPDEEGRSMTLTYLAHCKPCGGETPHRLVASTHGLLDDECTVCGHQHSDPDYGPPQEADPDAANDAAGWAA